MKLRADAAAGAPRAGQLVRTGDGWLGVLVGLGLPDQARLARLIAIDCSIGPAKRPPWTPAQADDGSA